MPPIPKPQAKQSREARKTAMLRRDARESQKVRERSGGRCERILRLVGGWMVRCPLRASEVHHLLKPRAKGDLSMPMMLPVAAKSYF